MDERFFRQKVLKLDQWVMCNVAGQKGRLPVKCYAKHRQVKAQQTFSKNQSLRN